ncbi:hypothetical protein [Oricola sp.]|uniref:hypothetical protein n=1 Tax=Oricola sp. TaxID=1979950 RepID=UPI0025ED25A6|nr:hypothetical protein [Oricola sp.]MCI5077264.1 hypothetical protein [Oricola sp.]
MKIRSMALCFLATLPVAATVAPVEANERESRFFRQIEGKWRGPGEIVAGKYKGTKFTCEFSGETPSNNLGMTLDGGCRVGFFSQKMKATVKRKGHGYTGTFMDGSDGEGLDVTAGAISPTRAVLTLKRNQLDGAMLARLASKNQLNITVSVTVGDTLVPVIGMKLDRVKRVANK